MDGKQILTNIYEGIMDRGAVVATTPHEWTYDFMSWWEVFEHDGIELADIDVISVYLREEGLLDGDKGVIFAIGEWLCDHAYKEYWTGLYTMKTCPECGATLFADMKVCYGCLHEFEDDEPTGMTWDEVIKRLMNEMTPEMLGQEATVWTEDGELHVYEVMNAEENGVVLHAC